MTDDTAKGSSFIKTFTEDLKILLDCYERPENKSSSRVTFATVSGASYAHDNKGKKYVLSIWYFWCDN